MNDGQPHQKSLLKVVVLGDAGVGKTSLVKQYVHGNFDPVYKPTIGADFLTKDVNLPGQGKLKLQIWDTAGQERFRSMAVSFYRGADACVLVYDICDAETFQHLEMWMKEFLENVGGDIGTEDFPFVVLGNKADKTEEIKISTSRAEAWCSTKKNVSLFETSALSKQNLDEAFNKVASAARRCLPLVPAVGVNDLDVNTALDDDKTVEDEPEPEKDTGNHSEPEEQKYATEEEPRRTEIRREIPKKSSKSKKKKSSRRNSVKGSHGSSKFSHKENQSSHASSKYAEKENRRDRKKKSARNSGSNSDVSSINSRNREDLESRSSNDSSPRRNRYSRAATPPYRNRGRDPINLEDDGYSTGSEPPISCCSL